MYELWVIFMGRYDKHREHFRRQNPNLIPVLKGLPYVMISSFSRSASSSYPVPKPNKAFFMKRSMIMQTTPTPRFEDTLKSALVNIHFKVDYLRRLAIDVVELCGACSLGDDSNLYLEI